MAGAFDRGYDRHVRLWRAAFLLDGALALTLLGFGAWVLSSPELDGHPVVLLPIIAPIFFRRRAPLTAVLAYAAGVVVSALPTLSQYRCGVAGPVALLLLFPLAARRDRQEGVAA